jgi:serine/threonine protein kinase
MLGPYRLLRVVARGDQTIVHSAERAGARHLGRVAIKCLEPNTHSSRVARLQHEARVLGLFNHPFVASALDFGHSDFGPTYLVLELVQGSSLSDIRREQGQVNVKRAVSIAMQALAGVAEAHRASVVHGSIHPRVIIAEPGMQEQVKLIGWSRAQIEGVDAPPARSLAADALPYVSPERLNSARFDALADLWSIAVCLYEALAGAHPFAMHTKVPVTAAIAAFHPPPLSAMRPEVDRRLEATLTRAMDKDPSRRFPSVEEMLDALAPHGRPGAVHLPWRPSSTPRPGVRSANLPPKSKEEGRAPANDEPRPKFFAQCFIIENPSLTRKGGDSPPPAKASAPLVEIGQPAVIGVTPNRANVIVSPFVKLDVRTTIRSEAIAPRCVKSAALHSSATSAMAVTTGGLFAWSIDDGWVEQRVGVAALMNGVTLSPAGDALVYGDYGFALLVPRGGQARSLGAPESLRVDAAALVGEGLAVLAGVDTKGKASRTVLAEIIGDDVRFRPVATPARIAAVAAAGDSFVAAGADGLFVVLQGGRATAESRGAYGFRAVAVDADGSGVAVGDRGRLLRFGTDTKAAGAPDHIYVNTTFTSACFAESVLWVGGDRILLRRDEHGGWRSMVVPSAVVSMVAERDRACLLLDDGTVLEVERV